MSTREFAKQTGRQHGNVMTTVRGMIARGELNIPESTWIGDNGKALPEFRLSRFDFEKMAYRLKSSDMEVVRRHFGVREMKIEPAPVLVRIGTVTPAAVKAPVTAAGGQLTTSLKLVPPVGAIFLPEGPGAITMSSLDIAELVGSRNDNVVRTIERLAERGVIQAPPSEELKNPGSGQKMKVRIFSGSQGKRDSIIVVAQLSPEFTARLVDRWQELEQQVAQPTFQVPTTFADALRLAGELEEQRVALTHQVETQVLKITEDAPKVEFYDNVAVAVGTQTVQEVAKEFGIGSTKFYKLLRDEKILMCHPNQNVPYQKHMDAGHFEVVVGEWKNQETGEIKLKPRSFVTAKGLIYLERRLNKLGHFRTTQVAA